MGLIPLKIMLLAGSAVDFEGFWEDVGWILSGRRLGTGPRATDPCPARKRFSVLVACLCVRQATQWQQALFGLTRVLAQLIVFIYPALRFGFGLVTSAAQA